MRALYYGCVRISKASLLTWFWALSVATAGARAQAVEVTGHEENPSILHADLPIPSDGVILGIAPIALAAEIHLYGSEGDEIAGSTRYLADGYWAWTADAPPGPGMYRATISAGLETIVLLEAEAAIELSEPWERQWPELASDASVSVVSSQTEGCCALNDDRDLESVSCAPTHEDTHLALSHGLTSPMPVAQLRQFMFRFSLPGTHTTVLAPWNLGLELLIFEDTIEPCYELEVLDPVTGETRSYDQLDRRCASTTEVDHLGGRSIAFLDDALDIAACPQPPPGEESRLRWCELNEAHCTSARAPADCHFYAYTCADAEHPGPFPSRLDDASPRTGSSGCSMLTRRVGCGWLELLAGAISLLTLRWWRKRAT